MNIQIDPEDIRSHLEVWAMSRQELAEKVGVPVKTVMDWEQGIAPVPLGKVEAVRKALDMGSETQPEFGHAALLQQLGRLAKQRREEIGLGRPTFAKEAGMGSDKTVTQFEFGRVLPSGTNQRRMEKALGWRLGVIDDIMRMTNRKAADITMEELDAEDSLHIAAQGGVGLALVSNEDLIEELRRRLLKSPAPLQNQDMQNLFGLAASTNVEHLEDDEGGTGE